MYVPSSVNSSLRSKIRNIEAWERNKFQPGRGGVVFLGKFLFALNHLLGCLKQFQQKKFWLDFGPSLAPGSQPRWLNPSLFFFFLMKPSLSNNIIISNYYNFKHVMLNNGYCRSIYTVDL